MKKSEIYRLAQTCVISAASITPGDRLAILRELMEKEDLALYVEKQEAVENAK